MRMHSRCTVRAKVRINQEVPEILNKLSDKNHLGGKCDSRYLDPRKSISRVPTKFGSKHDEFLAQLNEVFDNLDEDPVAEEHVNVRIVPTFESRFNFAEIKGRKKNPNDFNLVTLEKERER